jgi:hypothetical protein
MFNLGGNYFHYVVWYNISGMYAGHTKYIGRTVDYESLSYFIINNLLFSS